MSKFPNRVTHSKSYRVADIYENKRVLVIGNSASGHDITTLLVQSSKPKLPIYQSRQTSSRWDGKEPLEGIVWKPVIKEYNASTDEIIFEDGTHITDIDAVIYCTGYKPSYPFWNEQANGGALYDYKEGHLLDSFQHTFSRTFPYTLGMIGMPRVLTFRSFEYQAIALARLFSGRIAKPLPPLHEQEQWERRRVEIVQREKRKFHDIQWDSGETLNWLRFLFETSGLPVLEGLGRCPPVLEEKTRWAIEHIRKYPEPSRGWIAEEVEKEDGDWVVINNPPQKAKKDSLHFI